MEGKELKHRITDVVEELAETQQPKPEPLQEYRVRWSIIGTTIVEATDEEAAQEKFDTIDAESLVEDLVNIDVYDIDLWEGAEK